MIKEAKALILYREDLRETSKTNEIKNIDFNCFNPSCMGEFRMSDLVIFIDENARLKTKILKNRYGESDK